jgi:ribosomal protein L11 methyltransferase
VRTWPALEVGRLAEAGSDAGDRLQAALVDYAVAAIAEPAEDRWQIYFHDAAERQRAEAGLAREFPGLSFAVLEVPDDDWVARSQAALRAVRVDRIVVAPPWDVPSPAGPPGAPLVIVIRPSMGFGTAHHATTRLCLAELQQLDPRGCSVVDAGTGSGILAIAASLLGAAPVVALDDDPDALDAARDNLSLNARADVALLPTDVRTPPGRTFDLVLANLTGALLTAAAPAVLGLARPGGRLVLSGLLAEEEDRVLAAYAACLVHNRRQEGEWLLLSLVRP